MERKKSEKERDEKGLPTVGMKEKKKMFAEDGMPDQGQFKDRTDKGKGQEDDFLDEAKFRDHKNAAKNIKAGER